jgi:hypothetical protein
VPNVDWLPGAWPLDQLARRRLRAKALVIAPADGQCAAQTLGDETGSGSGVRWPTSPTRLLVKMRHGLVHDKVIRNALKRDI